MAVQISGDVPSSDDELDPQYVAASFVEQYYLFLKRSPELVHKFYNDHSILDHPGPDGEMVSMMTMQGINEKIMSSDYRGCSFEAIRFDAQASMMGGVLVAVNGYLIGKDNLKKSFNQTFFLAKQAKGYFVLNDILRFGKVLESETLPTCNGTKENASDSLFTHDQETPAQPKEMTDDGEKSSDMESREKASDAKTGNKSSDTRTGEKLPDTETGKKALNIDGEKNAADIDSGKKTVSDIKDTMAEAPNSSSNGSENESTLSHVASNEKQDAKKTSYASMVAKEGKLSSPTNNTGYKIVRVAPNADQQLIAPATPRDPGTMANSAKKELVASNAAAENNNARSDALAPKSIYIANLPWNITKHGLVDALKIFGRVRPGGVQIRAFEDGFCYGFVEFESASSASKAVEVHNVTVGGNEAYIMYKKSGGSRSGNSGGNAGSRSGNFKDQDTGEIHGNGGYPDDNQADIRSQPWGSGGQNGDNTNQKSQHRVGRAYPKSRQPSDERWHAGEAHRKSSHIRDERRKSGDAYQKNNKKQ